MTFSEHTQPVWSVQFNPQGTCIASVSSDRSAKLWSLETQECLHTFTIDPPMHSPLAFSPNGEILALAGNAGIRLWDVNTYRLVRSFPPSANLYHLRFSPDGQTLFSNSNMVRIQIWDTASARCLKTLQGKLLTFEAIAFQAQGTHFTSGSDDGSLRVWDMSNGECLMVLSEHTGKVTRLAYHSQKSVFASCSYDQTIKLWNDQGECLRSLGEHEAGVSAAVFHPEESVLISSTYGTTIRFWNTETGRLIDTLTVPAAAAIVHNLVLHPHGHLFATGSEDGGVRLWDYRSKRIVRQFTGHQQRAWALAFHPQAHWLASGGHDGKVNLWEFESGECVMTLEDSGNVLSVQFSPDGRLLAISRDRIIQVWDLTSMNCLYTFSDHTDNVSSLAFHSPNMLVSASHDETIRCWNLESGKCAKLLRPDRLYEGMNITGVKGLSEGQKAILERLGAIQA